MITKSSWRVRRIDQVLDWLRAHGLVYLAYALAVGSAAAWDLRAAVFVLAVALWLEVAQ